MNRVLCLLWVIGLLVSGCSWSSQRSDSNGYVSGDGTVHTIPESDRGEPITLTGRDLAGAKLIAPSTANRPTVVNIWWSGCAECRKEAATLRAAALDETVPADFYGINVRESGRPQAQRFEEHFGIPFPSFYDPGGSLLLQLHHTVPYSAIPTTVVLDNRGRPAAVILGTVPSVTTLRDLVADVSATPEGDRAGTAR